VFSRKKILEKIAVEREDRCRTYTRKKRERWLAIVTELKKKKDTITLLPEGRRTPRKSVPHHEGDTKNL